MEDCEDVDFEMTNQRATWPNLAVSTAVTSPIPPGGDMITIVFRGEFLLEDACKDDVVRLCCVRGVNEKLEVLRVNMAIANASADEFRSRIMKRPSGLSRVGCFFLFTQLSFKSCKALYFSMSRIGNAVL